MKIRTMGAELFQTDRRDEAYSLLSKFCKRITCRCLS